MAETTLVELYQSLNQRRRPEDVAHMVLEFQKSSLNSEEAVLLKRAAKGSLKEHVLSFAGYTSMAQDFKRPVGAERQVKKAQEIFRIASDMSAAQCSDPAAVERFIQWAGTTIKKTFGRNDFKADRLNRAQRETAGLDLSKRRYNKLFRHLERMEAKLRKLTRELRKFEFTMIGKSLLASKLTWEEFQRDGDAACFIAYYTARCNLRSEFTISGQQRPYDEIADMLFKRCRGTTSNYWAIAHVLPDREVLDHLSAQQKGELLGRWVEILRNVAGLLKEVWDSSSMDRAGMVVRRGNDSTTWNNTASAWNKARSSWISLVYALGMDDLLDTFCPGKVLRLMAADVVAWHRQCGGDIDPDTRVWNDVPLPWEVLNESESPICTRATIEEACRRHGVDPIKKGWSMPRPERTVAAFRPTPELVHGVAVSSPYLATILRKAGWFSG